MPTRLARLAAPATAALLLALGGPALMAQPARLPTPQASPGLPGETRPALLTSNPVNQVLPADSAFGFIAQLSDDTTQLQLHWEIAEGYYLYRKSLKLATADGEQLPLQLPDGSAIEDEFFGAVEVYFDQLQLNSREAVATARDNTLQLRVEYQGCASELYCYPPQHKDVELLLP